MEDRAIGRFYQAARIALFSVYLVILAGAVVRTTGSGRGCPDWPRCFGQRIPPTRVEQLPPDWKVRYNPHGHELEDFNAAKTWTEFINRDIGVLSGLATLWMLVCAWRLPSARRGPLLLSLLVLVLLAFQAWLGKKVVDTNLRENMITLHMVMAAVIVFVLLFILRPYWTVHQPAAGMPRWLASLQLGLVFLGLVQLALGTQVREQVDALLSQLDDRTAVTAALGPMVYIHRSFSLLVLAGTVWIFLRLGRMRHLQPGLYAWGLGVLLLLVAMIVSGMVLYYLALPVAVQPVHLLLSMLLLSAMFILYLRLHAAARPSIASRL